jgi:hypothetical protein
MDRKGGLAGLAPLRTQIDPHCEHRATVPLETASGDDDGGELDRLAG